MCAALGMVYDMACTRFRSVALQVRVTDGSGASYVCVESMVDGLLP
jgi:hypothetical protein